MNLNDIKLNVLKIGKFSAILCLALSSIFLSLPHKINVVGPIPYIIYYTVDSLHTRMIDERARVTHILQHNIFGGKYLQWLTRNKNDDNSAKKKQIKIAEINVFTLISRSIIYFFYNWVYTLVGVTKHVFDYIMKIIRTKKKEKNWNALISKNVYTYNFIAWMYNNIML